MKCLKRNCLKFCVSFSFCQHESTTICVNQHEFSNDFSPLEWVCAHTDYQAGSHPGWTQPRHPGGIVLRCPNLSEPFRCVRAVLYSEVFTFSLTNRKTPFSSSALPSVTTHRSWPQIRVKQTEWSVGSIALMLSCLFTPADWYNLCSHAVNLPWNVINQISFRLDRPVPRTFRSYMVPTHTCYIRTHIRLEVWR